MYFAISLQLSLGPVSSNLVQVLPINFFKHFLKYKAISEWQLQFTVCEGGYHIVLLLYTTTAHHLTVYYTILSNGWILLDDVLWGVRNRGLCCVGTMPGRNSVVCMYWVMLVKEVHGYSAEVRRLLPSD